MLELVLILFVAHILGDFFFLPDAWKEDIGRARIRSRFLYAYALLHTLLVLPVLGIDPKAWLLIPATFISHLSIQTGAAYLGRKRSERWRFFLVQGLYVGIIIGLISIYSPFQLDPVWLLSPHLLLGALALLCITVVSSEMIKQLMSWWVLVEDNQNDSLRSAGSFIGMLERMFVFGFIIVGQWQAIGLLIAAKSVFRFGDLSRAKDRKLTEYILIGTMLSFGLAILIGLGYQVAKTLIPPTQSL